MTTLTDKIQALPPDLQLDVEEFIEFLLMKAQRRRAVATDDAAYWQAASRPALDAVWGNDEDDIYAELLTS